MSIVETVERKGQLRAIIFYGLALGLLAALLFSFGAPSTGPRESIWVALATASAINLSPMLRWLKPNNPIARLLEDETAHEHRRRSMTTGFWAATLAVFVLVLVTDDNLVLVSAYDAARLIGTAAIVAALVSFATLELRAARG